MSTTMSTAPGRRDHPPDPAPETTLTAVHRVSIVDRIALQLGVALIKWGRRPRLIPTRERIAAVVEHRLDEQSRERAAERALHLTASRH